MYIVCTMVFLIWRNMENSNPESVIRELRNLTNKLNSITHHVRELNDRFHQASSEKRMYEFLEKIVDKVLKHQKHE